MYVFHALHRLPPALMSPQHPVDFCPPSRLQYVGILCILSLTLRQVKRSLISKQTGRQVSEVNVQLLCLTYMNICQGQLVGNKP